jgi:penicillin-binding protein 1C
MRDNWCVGFSRHYTVAIWVGNFEGDSMHEVSGVTGAAPIWHDIVESLETTSASSAPPAPDGVLSESTAFSPAVEPPRREWYLAGTELAHQSIAVPDHERPKIDSPANGMIIAIDPDIPSDHQKVPIAVKGGAADLQLRLNDHPLGSAASTLLWAPQPGAWHLTLEDAQGRALDRVLFTVRSGRP